MFKNLFNSIKVIVSEFRTPTKTYEYKDLRKLIILREKKRLAKLCNIKKFDAFCAGVISISRLEGFNPWCIITQAWHESGAFKRVIGNYNFWGIKKTRRWTGKICAVTTHEYVKGVKTKMKLDFIDFPDLPAALIWYVAFIKRMYPIAYINRDNPESYFLGMVIGRWKFATDPEYVQKLNNTYKKLRKNIYLKELLKGD